MPQTKIDKQLRGIKSRDARRKKPAKKATTGTKKATTGTKKATGQCKCGCGSPVVRLFRQGHDARYAGAVKKLQDGRWKAGDVTSRYGAKLGGSLLESIKVHEQIAA